MGSTAVFAPVGLSLSSVALLSAALCAAAVFTGLMYVIGWPLLKSIPLRRKLQHLPGPVPQSRMFGWLIGCVPELIQRPMQMVRPYELPGERRKRT